MKFSPTQTASVLLVSFCFLMPSLVKAQGLVEGDGLFASTIPFYCPENGQCSLRINIANLASSKLIIDNFLIYIGPDVEENDFEAIPQPDQNITYETILVCTATVNSPTHYELPPFGQRTIKVPVPGATLTYATVTGVQLPGNQVYLNPPGKPSVNPGVNSLHAPMLSWEALDTITGQTLADEHTPFLPTQADKELIVGPISAVPESRTDWDCSHLGDYAGDCTCPDPPENK
jgi:hypothetical protein